MGRAMKCDHRMGLRSCATWFVLLWALGCGNESTTVQMMDSMDAMGRIDAEPIPDMARTSSDMTIPVESDMAGMACPECSGLQRCNAMTGQCEEPSVCSEDFDCLAGRICTDGRCTDGCVSEGCPGELTCIDSSGRCTEETDCRSDAGCMNDRVCVLGTCTDPCLEDANCPGRQVCALDLGRCMEPAMCLSAEDCRGDRLCIDGTCIAPCSADAPCPENFLCENGECIEGDRCTINAHCRGDRLCLDGECSDRCREDADCPGARLCQVGTGLCPEPDRCDVDAACDPGRVCVDARCTDPCAPEDCPGAQRCLDNRCVEPVECIEDGDCIGRRYCDAGTCRAPCEENADCFGADTCDIDNGRCLSAYPGCRMDNDCMPREACIRGVCRQVGCQEHDDCQDRCVDQACGPPFGVDCAADQDCVVGFLCALPVGACVDGGCIIDAECGGLTPLCRAGRCSACRADEHCSGSEYCSDGRCIHHGACEQDRECPGPNTACIQGACVAPPCGGDAFDDDRVIPTLATRTYSDLVLCDGDEDQYRVDLWPGQGLQATLRHLPEDGELELVVGSLDEESVARVENGVAVAGILAQDLIRRAEITVRGRAGFRTRYSLDLRRIENQACVPDENEPLRGNNTQNQAQRWQGETVTNRLCEGDQDWYRVRLPGGNTFEVQLTSDNLNAVQMTLHDERGIEVSRGENDGRALTLSADIPQDAPYALRVELGVGGGSATSMISSSVTPGPERVNAACEGAPRVNVGQPYWLPPMLDVDRFSGGCQEDAGRFDRVLDVRIQEPGRYAIRTLREDRGGALFLRQQCALEDSEIGCAQGGEDLVVDLQPGTYFLVVDMTLTDGQGVEVLRVD